MRSNPVGRRSRPIITARALILVGVSSLFVVRPVVPQGLAAAAANLDWQERAEAVFRVVDVASSQVRALMAQADYPGVPDSALTQTRAGLIALLGQLDPRLKVFIGDSVVPLSGPFRLGETVDTAQGFLIEGNQLQLAGALELRPVTTDSVKPYGERPLLLPDELCLDLGQAVENLIPCVYEDRGFWDRVIRLSEKQVSTSEGCCCEACCCECKCSACQACCRGCKCEEEKKKSDDGVLTPLFGLGPQVLLRPGSDRRTAIGLAFSNNIPNSIVSELIGKVFGKSGFLKFLERGLSLDFVYVCCLDGRGRILTGLSASLFQVDMGSLTLGFAGFLRSIPDEFLAPAFLNRSLAIDPEVSVHSTPGLRLDIFATPRTINQKPAGLWKLKILSGRPYLSIEWSGVVATPSGGLSVVKKVVGVEAVPRFRRTGYHNVAVSLGLAWWPS